MRLVVFDFDGVFTDNKVIVNERGEESVVCSRADGYGLAKLKMIGVEAMVLSSEINPVVSARCRKLKIDCVQACENKAEKLLELASRRKISLAQIVFVGNDVNDLGCMRAVGIPIAVKDAYPEALELASFVTERCGGNGAVREICDEITAAKGKN